MGPEKESKLPAITPELGEKYKKELFKQPEQVNTELLKASCSALVDAIIGSDISDNAKRQLLDSLSYVYRNELRATPESDPWGVLWNGSPKTAEEPLDTTA